MEKFKLKEISLEQTLLKDFFSALELESKVLDFQNELILKEEGDYNLEQTIAFFKSKQKALNLFKNFKEKTQNNKFSNDILGITASPLTYFSNDVISVKIQIADFFRMYEFKSDENPTELNEPEIQKRIFLDFINQLKISSAGVINLPYPPFKDTGLDNEYYYDGFIDAYFGTSLFDDFLSAVIARKEEEDVKESKFLESFEQKVNNLISEPKNFIHKIYLNLETQTANKNSNGKNWLINFTRTTNKW